MTDHVADWSPADSPEAIAVSEVHWWARAAELAVLRMRGPDDHRISWFSSRQIDARQLILALRQLLSAVTLVDGRLEELGLDRERNALRLAKDRYEGNLTGLTEVRNALMHFEAWALGAGHGPQRRRVAEGVSVREVASEFWGFAYDGQNETISLGPYTVHVTAVGGAVAQLSDAVYEAARAVDRRNAIDLGREVKDALAAAAVSTDEDWSSTKLIVGRDNRLRLSLDSVRAAEQIDRYALADRIIEALRAAGIKLIHLEMPNELDLSGPLGRGVELVCERNPY